MSPHIYPFRLLGSPPDTRATTADGATAGSATCSAIMLCVALRTTPRLRPRLEVLDEAAEGVARDELLAHQLDARRGRGGVVLEPLLDGAALVREAVGLFRDGEGR